MDEGNGVVYSIFDYTTFLVAYIQFSPVFSIGCISNSSLYLDPYDLFIALGSLCEKHPVAVLTLGVPTPMSDRWGRERPVGGFMTSLRHTKGVVTQPLER